MPEVLMDIRQLTKTFLVSKGFLQAHAQQVRAVRDVSLQLYAGETLGLVGESGCGKSTLGRLCLCLENPTAGEIFFEGHNIFNFTRQERQEFRRQVQIVFQDPYASLNPRRTAGQTISEPLAINNPRGRGDRRQETLRMMRTVGLSEEQAARYPHEFSGGQRQRIGIARAVALRPKLIVADEPVSALDVSIQAQILNLMKQLQNEFGLTYLFITHDLSVVRYMSDRIAVMYLGRIVEMAHNEDIFSRPLHPYTRALLEAIPVADPQKKLRLTGLVGDAATDGSGQTGCLFYPRCLQHDDGCRNLNPELIDCGNDHWVACHKGVK